MSQFEAALAVYNTNSSKKERGIVISIRSGTKTRRLQKTFKKNDTIATVKQAFIDEINPDKQVNAIQLAYRNKTLENHNTLQSSGIVKAACLTLKFKTRGGMAQMLQQNQRKKKVYDPKRRLDTDDPEIKLTNSACCMYGYTNSDGVQRARMPCGDAISPPAMLKWIQTIYGSNENDYEINCPKCKQEWDFSLCLKVAVLDDDDYMYYDEQYEIRSAPEEKQCPTCQEFNERPSDLLMFRVNCPACSGRDWCWNCEKPWNSSSFAICGNHGCPTAEINEDLRSCPMKNTTYKDKSNGQWIQVPTIRACPKCFCFIEHETACKHMTCPDCKTNFCFACLQLKKSDGNWPCGEYYNQCPVAPRQQLR